MLLEGKQLAMRYGEETIFEKLDLRLDKGQSLAVTGASGCGSEPGSCCCHTENE